MSYIQRSGRLERWRAHVAWLVVAALLTAGCGDGSGDAETSATSSTILSTTTTSTAAPTATSAPVAPTSTTAPASAEPPVIELAGYTTVFSQDGRVRVSGWLDRPAEVTVGGNPVPVLDNQYDGMISTFETVLELDPGEYGIPIAATDSRGLHSEIFLSVLVDPALEIQLALIDEVDLVERTVVAEYVEFLSGDEATIAAREDGVIGDSEETPGGFYLRKRDPVLHTLTLGDPEMVTVLACFEQGPCAAEHAVELDIWAELLANPDMAEDQLGWFWVGAGQAPYWLTVQDGIIVQIVEQYLP